MDLIDTATITTRGRVTIPKSIRTELDLAPGVQLRFSVTDDGVLIVSKLDDPREMLDSVRQQLGGLEINIDELRRESKAHWS